MQLNAIQCISAILAIFLKITPPRNFVDFIDFLHPFLTKVEKAKISENCGRWSYNDLTVVTRISSLSYSAP